MSNDDKKYGAHLYFGGGLHGVQLSGTISSREEMETVIGVLRAITPLVFPASETSGDLALNGETGTQSDNSGTETCA